MRGALSKQELCARSKSDRECAQREALGHIVIVFTKGAEMGMRRTRLDQCEHIANENSYVLASLMRSSLFKFAPSMYLLVPFWSSVQNVLSICAPFSAWVHPDTKMKSDLVVRSRSGLLSGSFYIRSQSRHVLTLGARG